MNIREIEQASQRILTLLGDYRRDPGQRRELKIDEAVYAHFEGRFGSMSRQHPVTFSRSTAPGRIDFRHGGPNPVLIELAVRPPDGQSELYGSQNLSELKKLTRIVASQARLRVLLLLDLAPSPITEGRLKATYDAHNAGRGNFERHPVRVIYVHREMTYDFSWRP